MLPRMLQPFDRRHDKPSIGGSGFPPLKRQNPTRLKKDPFSQADDSPQSIARPSNTQIIFSSLSDKLSDDPCRKS
jgi:hypothetical protein